MLVMALLACGGAGLIGPKGGTVSEGPVSVVFPEDALAEKTEVTVSAYTPPEGLVMLSEGWEVAPVGTELAVPATLAITLEEPNPDAVWLWSTDGLNFQNLPTTVEGAEVSAPIEVLGMGFVGQLR